jgi:hypothetical protein
MSEQKKCSREQCEQQNPQPLSNFFKRGDTKSGFMSRCKSCLKEIDLKRKDKTIQYKRKWKMNNRDKVKKYYENNKEEILQKSKNYNHKPEIKMKVKNRNLLKNYGLTLDQYNQMLVNQNHKCDICSIDEVNAGKKGLFVDHNHITNEVRSLLCNTCNFLIGQSKESPAILRNAANYLENHKNKKNNVIILKEVLNVR